MPPEILLVSPVSEALKTRLAEHYAVHESLSQKGRAELLVRIGKRVDVILGWHEIDDELLDACPNAGLIATYATGFDNVDLERARAEGRVVANAPGLNRRAVAEMALLLTLASLRNLPDLDAYVRTGRWCSEPPPLPAPGLCDSRIGVAGAGGIGGEILRVMAPLAAELHYFARHAHDVPGRHHSTLIEMADRVDVLILALPGGEATRRIVGSEVLSKLGPGGVLVNVGRGSTVDEDALCEALQHKRLLFGALDVFATEPDVAAQLRALPNTVFTPHCAGGTRVARVAKEDLLMHSLHRYFAGAPVPNAVVGAARTSPFTAS